MPGDRNAFLLPLADFDERYTTEDLLGTGTYGQVHRALDTCNENEAVAVKIIDLKAPNLKGSDPDKTTKMINNELDGLARVANPSSGLGDRRPWTAHILKLRHWTQDSTQNRFLIASDLHACDLLRFAWILHGKRAAPEGAAPRVFSREVRVLESFAQRVAVHVCRGLWCMRRCDLIHRDLKPDNIMLSKIELSDADLVIIDLGHAKKFREGSMASTATVGTPWFRAPELIREKGYSSKVDCWALGMTLVYVLTGSYPFERKARSQSQLLLLLENSEWFWDADFDPSKACPVIPPSQWRGLSVGCRRTLWCLLRGDPRLRWDAGQLLDDEPWIASPPDSALASYERPGVFALQASAVTGAGSAPASALVSPVPTTLSTPAHATRRGGAGRSESAPSDVDRSVGAQSAAAVSVAQGRRALLSAVSPTSLTAYRSATSSGPASSRGGAGGMPPIPPSPAASQPVTACAGGSASGAAATGVAAILPWGGGGRSISTPPPGLIRALLDQARLASALKFVDVAMREEMEEAPFEALAQADAAAPTPVLVDFASLHRARQMRVYGTHDSGEDTFVEMPRINGSASVRDAAAATGHAHGSASACSAGSASTHASDCQCRNAGSGDCGNAISGGTSSDSVGGTSSDRINASSGCAGESSGGSGAGAAAEAAPCSTMPSLRANASHDAVSSVFAASARGAALQDRAQPSQQTSGLLAQLKVPTYYNSAAGYVAGESGSAPAARHGAATSDPRKCGPGRLLCPACVAERMQRVEAASTAAAAELDAAEESTIG